MNSQNDEVQPNPLYTPLLPSWRIPISSNKVGSGSTESTNAQWSKFSIVPQSPQIAPTKASLPSPAPLHQRPLTPPFQTSNLSYPITSTPKYLSATVNLPPWRHQPPHSQ